MTKGNHRPISVQALDSNGGPLGKPQSITFTVPGPVPGTGMTQNATGSQPSKTNNTSGGQNTGSSQATDASQNQVAQSSQNNTIGTSVLNAGGGLQGNTIGNPKTVGLNQSASSIDNNISTTSAP